MEEKSTETFVESDEYTHDPTEDPQFNESMYYNLVDGESRFATLIRMGNRVNEGHAEVTVLAYLPDGRAAIHFKRAPIADNTKFDAGGLRFEVLEPLKRIGITYQGEMYLLSSGTDLEDPKKAFRESPVIRGHLDLEYENFIPVYGLAQTETGAGGIAGGEETIAARHYQAPCRVRGTILLGEDEFEVSGLGWRDHSWGPRKWQGPRYWRWISCLCDESNGFVGWVNRIGDERPPGNGMVLWNGDFQLVRAMDIKSTYGPPPHYPEAMRLTLTTDKGTYEATGEAFSLVPLRHRREGVTARLAEIVCSYELGDKRGYGIAEYHDLMEGGIPAGMDEA